jgi:hypothetical protein
VYLRYEWATADEDLMPKVTPGPGQAVEETTVTRILPDTKAESEKLSSDPFEYIDTISRERWDQGEHMLYIYRVEPPVYRNAAGPTYVTKYATPITLEQIQSEYGGGLWRILIKRGRERVADRMYPVGGTPRDLTRATQEFNPALPGGVPATEQPGGVVSQAMNIVSDPRAREAQTQMLTSAATSAIELVKQNASQQMTVKDILELAEKLSQRPAEKPFLETEVGKILLAAASTLVTVLVQRMVSPADPLDQLGKIAEAAKLFGGGNSGTDWKAALVHAAPQIAEAGRGMLQELRLGTEAQMRINAGRTLTAPPPPPAPPVQQNPAQQNVVQMPAPAAQPGAQSMEAFEAKLVELLNDPNMTGDKAGEILDETWPRFVDEVSRYSVDMIVGVFPTRPILAPHAQNPRLRQFITEFLQWANETDAPPATPPAPAV